MPSATEPVLPNRLRAKKSSRLFSVMLVEPEIPPNTGNIARLCAATSCPLHLVEPLGFSIDAHAVRRAGLDYWSLVEVRTHASFTAAETAIRADAAPAEPRFWLLSGKAERSYLDVEFAERDVLVFGKESVGLPEALLRETRAGHRNPDDRSRAFAEPGKLRCHRPLRGPAASGRSPRRVHGAVSG